MPTSTSLTIFNPLVVIVKWCCQSALVHVTLSGVPDVAVLATQLSSEVHWYPDISNLVKLFTFRVFTYTHPSPSLPGRHLLLLSPLFLGAHSDNTEKVWGRTFPVSLLGLLLSTSLPGVGKLYMNKMWPLIMSWSRQLLSSGRKAWVACKLCFMAMSCIVCAGVKWLLSLLTFNPWTSICEIRSFVWQPTVGTVYTEVVQITDYA